MTEEHWQLKMVDKSLKKKEKRWLLNKHLNVDQSATILDLGCAQGILSFFLRKKGGTWISADQDYTNLETSQKLLKSNLVQLGNGALPFRNESLDMVVSLDYLEHQENDLLCLQEIQRILKKGGLLVLAVPRTGFLFIQHKLRNLLGLKLEFYGHKREGYSLNLLKSKLSQAKLEYLKHKTFSRFFTELIELILNFLYIKIFSPTQIQQLRDGHIRPSTADEFHSRRKAFKVYSWIYPIVWLVTRLDRLFFFQRGYGLMIWAVKSHNTHK